MAGQRLIKVGYARLVVGKGWLWLVEGAQGSVGWQGLVKVDYGRVKVDKGWLWQVSG
jgi:hypothetical protein